MFGERELLEKMCTVLIALIVLFVVFTATYSTSDVLLSFEQVFLEAEGSLFSRRCDRRCGGRCGANVYTAVAARLVTRCSCIVY